jgi:short-subunit dehydrogenase
MFQVRLNATSRDHTSLTSFPSNEECRSQFETNFFGPLNLCRLIVPIMRARRSGTIVNISSTAGIEAKPSRSMYSGSKFALEAMSEALYHEMKPFGVRVLIVEPGAFGTNMPGALVAPKMELPGDYEGTVTETAVNAVKNMQGGKVPGDVQKGVQAIFDVVMKSGQADGMEEFLRLPLGKDGSARWRVKLADLQRNLDGTEKIWSKTDKDP